MSNVSIDLNKMLRLDDISTYNNNWYKVNKNTYILAKTNEEYEYVEFYISDTIGGYEVFLFCDDWRSDDVYYGELGVFFT